VEEPEFPVSEGVLAPGEALLFYTDGVVERPTSDIDTGIDWLRAAAREAVRDEGMGAVPARIMELVNRGDDDRAVLVLARE
jgi:serine phosphatase RsbU (regulator of sigma subunit)